MRESRGTHITISHKGVELSRRPHLKSHPTFQSPQYCGSRVSALPVNFEAVHNLLGRVTLRRGH